MRTFNRATDEFFAACQQEKLLLQYCQHCRKHIYYLRSFCPHCLGELELVEASGTGRIVTYTVVYKNPFDLYFEQMTPYVAGLIELDEGVFMYARILTGDQKEVEIGRRVEVVFIDRHGKKVPAFKIVGNER